MRTIEMCVIVIILTILSLVMCGCEEAQQQRLWGQGDPPADYQRMFGNSNIARLNFVQTNTINEMRAALYGVDNRGVDGKIEHTQGIIERVRALEVENPAELAKRVRKLEEVAEEKRMTK